MPTCSATSPCVGGDRPDRGDRPGPRRRRDARAVGRSACRRCRIHRRRHRAGRGRSVRGSGTRCSTGPSTRTLGRLIDPSVGGLELGLGVVGGLLTGAYVASLLGAPLGRWLHLAALPGPVRARGRQADPHPDRLWAGPPEHGSVGDGIPRRGAVGSLAPALPSNPSQAYEGIATLAILLVLTLVVMFAVSKGVMDACSISPSVSGRWRGSPSRPPGAIRSSPSV